MSKKLIIAISALALAIIAGVVAVVGVFAAQQQKVANTFTISYTANNVKASIMGGYYYKGSTEYQGAGVVQFSPEENEQTKKISPNITLSAETPGVKLTFIVDNNASVGGKNISVTLTDSTAVKENVNVYYAVSTDTSLGPTVPYEDIAVEANKTLPDTVFVQPYNASEGVYSTTFFFVVIEIADPTLDAKYETTEDAGLHFTLASAD